jgi:DNA-binding NarL/FixJ family response regulator
VLSAYAFLANSSGQWQAAADLTERAIAMARAAGDVDALTLALTQSGAALIALGQAGQALRRLDEAMLAVVSAGVSPIAAGTVYCTVISLCSELRELPRAQEWTDALTAWLDRQGDSVVFTGQCMVHRAELLQLHGDWTGAAEEAERACRQLSRTFEVAASGAARYQQAEILRRQGRYAAAEKAYQQAHDWGHDPHPGLALLRLAQGDRPTARAALQRALGETVLPLRRARMLPGLVEVALADADIAEAREAAAELAVIADAYGATELRAVAAWADGAVRLADADPSGALAALRTAAARWRELAIPYEAARTRVLIARACEAMGDTETAAMERTAADAVFAGLGAEPDRIQADQPSHGLSARELQVLRLVATGRTNSAIARELALSEKTIERHLSNIFTKIGVSSRAGATAYAFSHGLADGGNPA